MTGDDSDGLRPRETGWTVGDHVRELLADDLNPADHIYYVTYSNVYHSNPLCPHLAGSESVWCASSLYALSTMAEPYCTGPRDTLRETAECSWCAGNDPPDSDDIEAAFTTADG